MKKIITSLGMIVFVGAVVAGGTGAFFSDTETSTANVFTAGALDLKVDSVAHVNGLVCFDDQWVPEDQVEWNPETEENELVNGADVPAAIDEYNEEFPANVPQAGEECGGTWTLTDLGPEHTFFDYGDLKPGDNGENTISLHVINNDAYMCAIIDNVENNDNGLTEPESEVDNTGGDGEGELGQELSFFIWEDDGDNIFEDNEQVLVANATGEDVAGTYPLFTPETGAITGSSTSYLGVYWCYGDFNGVGDCDGSSATNLTQTDSLKADITFQIEQARNNDDFTCGEVVEPAETTLTLAKAVLPPEVALDTDFTLSAVGPTSSISGVEGDVSITSAIILPGVYALSEVGGPGGETSIVWECSGNATAEVDNGNGTATVTIAEGEDVVCGVTNNYPEDNTATTTVE